MLNIFWGVAILLLVLWVLGFALNFTLGGALHVLIVLAIVAVIARLVLGRRATA